ncbi:Endoribonuclease L-PSP/chorismate mutase-like protein [Diplogelasinospora grovesii]|uniref:Endoribonuclease L-PSP/chorismate mutase-like protein n=1 Tax=Diplogelasinospora grovesii TaxID=303347 RepID=A0AAN6NGD1_9PEZI|nr:Endoribonuclease L-PSP/chorismate mutase-like protein [Diplogelasinospora grovesii]
MFIARRALPVIFRSTLHKPSPSRLPLIRKMSAVPVFTKNAAPAAGPYSQAIKTPHAIYVSGQIPCDPQGNLVEGTIQQKTATCIGNMKAILEEAGSGIEKVVKLTIFLADMADFANMNEEYAKWFTHKPARSCVAAKQLPKGVSVEIECIALP